MKPKASLFVLVAISCCMALFSLIASAQEMPAAQVTSVEISTQALAPKIELKGNVVSLQNATIGAEVAGQLLSIGLVGEVFTQGQSIAQIDDEPLKIQLGIASANLKSLQADLVFRNSEVERFSLLAKKDNASKTQLQQAIAIRDMLNQDIVMAQLRIAAAKRDLAKSALPAPFNGVLTQQHAQTGAFINQGQPVARIVDTQNIEVSVPVPLSYFKLLRAGDEVSVTSAHGEHSLKVREVVPVGDEQTRMAEVRLSAKGSELIVGESVSVFAPRARAQTHIAVPRDALVIRGKQTFVYRINDNKAEQVMVKVLFADGDIVAVDGKVNSGDRLITRGAERLQPGSPVVEI